MNQFADQASSDPTVTTSISGIAGVSILSFDTTEFVVVQSPARSDLLVGVFVGTPPTAAQGVVCAYAFVSDELPEAGTSLTPGAPPGCAVSLPGLGSPAPGCTGAVSVVEVIDLVHGTTTGSLAGACHVVAGAVVGAIILYISYAIVTTSAAAPAKLCSFTFSISPD
ncbi:MAG: hypothetical protein L3J96_03860 [Thermoplasmata archaeon]|nr:hypothetical protein [Thermoplasmata archaeon]